LVKDGRHRAADLDTRTCRTGSWTDSDPPYNLYRCPRHIDSRISHEEQRGRLCYDRTHRRDCGLREAKINQTAKDVFSLYAWATLGVERTVYQLEVELPQVGEWDGVIFCDAMCSLHHEAGHRIANKRLIVASDTTQ
jgi:hypothetical protein